VEKQAEPRVTDVKYAIDIYPETRGMEMRGEQTVVNKTPQVYDFSQVREQVEALYRAEVAAVLPHSDEMMALASAGIFALRYPDHEVTQLYRQVAEKLIA